jgi:hypothetical protein
MPLKGSNVVLTESGVIHHIINCIGTNTVESAGTYVPTVENQVQTSF